MISPLFIIYHPFIYIISYPHRMRRKNKETDDIESQENSSMNSEEPQTKSFMVGGGQKTVTLAIPGILPSIKTSR